MPRFPRSYIKTSFFHIMTQGIEKNFIFEQSTDIKYYIGTMYRLKEEYDIKLRAYCIMKNHAHLLLETENINNLSKYMQRLNSTYAIYYNKKYNRVGYVFRDRYKSEGIYSEQHLYNCIKYIYDNPVKAGICNYPEEYPYTNYKENKDKLNKIEDEYSFIDIDEDSYDICEKVIIDFLELNKITMNELKEDKRKLRQLVINLKNEYNISLRKISEKINMSRESVRYLYKY